MGVDTKVISFVTAYNLTCPHPGQWELRAKVKNCSSIENYVCLFDAVQLTFAEICKKPQLERKGNKLFLNKGNFDRKPCSPTHYQPFRFNSFGNTNCTHLKSPCSEEGQVIADNHTSYSDRSCRCDYRRGFALIVNTSQPCSCMPSKEDCSCYLKTCSMNEVLSQGNQDKKNENNNDDTKDKTLENVDYNCINETQQQGTYQCPSILNRGSRTPATDVVPVDVFVPISYIKGKSF
ncbi:unnamed protein product [Mytilus coruscus]|uniref:Uncharacterized protein n=1 Tax=Mytilus coruscus TaxID=42192 RepID=A0A6J8AN79_MYTCO|nr:unnamed protein product [Mytilus coruscus]